MAAIDIVLDSISVTRWVSEKQKSIPEVLGAKIDAVNAKFMAAVRGNLSGGVLNTVSGKLLDTVQQIPAQISADEIYGAVEAGGPEAPYGIYFEEGGTHPYTIVPINARVLAFMGAGGMVFAKIVHHPPIPHLPWFGPEVPDAQEAMNIAIREGFDEVFGE